MTDLYVFRSGPHQREYDNFVKNMSRLLGLFWAGVRAWYRKTQGWQPWWSAGSPAAAAAVGWVGNISILIHTLPHRPDTKNNIVKFARKFSLTGTSLLKRLPGLRLLQVFTNMRIRNQVFTYMRILTLLFIKVLGISDHWSTVPQGLHFEPPRLHCYESTALHGSISSLNASKFWL